ncbi:hypothetical protein WA026_021577 [Henosepilachna vigintioctopunctata]|uniref:Uncharacterized protein n=1 Tax=Henosepilachna vigintioctopunctata TaxID=420089 RepID=A0AAW1VJ48_9CUCU
MSRRQTMLDIFNDARNAVANGTKKFDFGNTGAKRMNALSYDMELEYLVTCHLNQCDSKYRLEGCHDSSCFWGWGNYEAFGIGNERGSNSSYMERSSSLVLDLALSHKQENCRDLTSFS